MAYLRICLVKREREGVFEQILFTNENKILKITLEWLRVIFDTGNENGCEIHGLPANQGKMTNQLRWQLRENCWQDREIFPQTWKRTKIQTNGTH